jgi:hypothetical protein
MDQKHDEEQRRHEGHAAIQQEIDIAVRVLGTHDGFTCNVRVWAVHRVFLPERALRVRDHVVTNIKRRVGERDEPPTSMLDPAAGMWGSACTQAPFLPAQCLTDFCTENSYYEYGLPHVVSMTYGFHNMLNIYGRIYA